MLNGCFMLTVGDDIYGLICSFWNFAKNAFVNFSIADAVDIFLLTVLFSLAFRFLRKRKAGALIFGIIICLMVFIISSIVPLTGIRFILSGLFQIGAIALVVIFQPELRELLESVGSGSLKGIRSFGQDERNKEAQYRTIKNISKAVHILSVEKTGALIVVTRTTRLDDIIQSGTVINADVSDALLRNLFYNKAPLHDGAVIIDGDRIVAASCILPLPRRTYVEQDLGTRHRAAIGLSEISDAIIIAVSEETGIISVAKECELSRGFTDETLRKYLVREILREDFDDNN